MALHVYDTRTREKRLFETARTGEVDMYVCGITPYSPSHLGHARCYIEIVVYPRSYLHPLVFLYGDRNGRLVFAPVNCVRFPQL